MKKNYKITAKVWRWPGDMGWHFVNIPTDISESIRAVYKKGFVYVAVRVGKTSWDTALFPHKLSKAYLLSIKAPVRKKEDIWAGDTIDISFKIK